MDLYTGQINEFVGGSIRELLQRKLKEPFVMKEDPENNKYRLFSSEEAYALWRENPTDNQDLELFNFARPSDYKLELASTYAGGFDNKYIRYGDSSSISAYIAFSWNISNDEGDSSESMSMTYTI